MTRAWKNEAHKNHNITNHKLTNEDRRSSQVWRNEGGIQALKLKQRRTKLESLWTEERMVLSEAWDPFQSCQLSNLEEERLLGWAETSSKRALGRKQRCNCLRCLNPQPYWVLITPQNAWQSMLFFGLKWVDCRLAQSVFNSQVYVILSNPTQVWQICMSEIVS